MPRYKCKHCKGTISVRDQRLLPRRQYSIEALLPAMVMYLTEFISYDHTAWTQEAIEPAASTIWRAMHSLAGAASARWLTLQRRLVESGVPLLELAFRAEISPNLAKARRADMLRGLVSASQLLQVAQQFLPTRLLGGFVLGGDIYQRYPPHSSECAIF